MKRLLALTLLALAAAPGAAQAATYCVGSPSYCPGGASAVTNLTLTQALAAAQASKTADDTIKLGKGTFTTPGGFTYDAGGNANNGLWLEGEVLDGETILKPDAPSKPDGFTTLSVTGVAPGDDAVLLSFLEVEVPSGDTTGVDLRNARMEYVDVRANGGAAVGARLDDGATARFGSMSAIDGTALKAAGTGNDVQDVELSGKTGFAAVDGGDAYLGRAEIQATETGISAVGAKLVTDSSLVKIDGDASGVLARTAGSVAGTVTGSNLTVVGKVGPGPDTSIGLEAYATGIKDATISLDNTIVRAAPTSARAEDNNSPGGAHITTDYSSISGTPAIVGNGSTIGGTHEIADTPLFVDVKDTGGDFHQIATSPLLDRGTNAPISNPLNVDLGLKPRKVDAKPGAGPAATIDLGAYEYQANDPFAKIEGPTTVVQGASATFTGANSGTGGDPGDYIKAYSWSASDGGKGSGAALTRTFDTVGTVTLTLAVMDANGQTDTATHAVTVTAKPVATVTASPSPSAQPSASPDPSPSPSPTASASPSPTPIATVTPAPDRTAPTVKAAYKRKRVRVTLSEAARVTIAVKGRKPVVRSLKAGTSSIGLKLGRGRHTLRISAVDAAGNAARTLKVRTPRLRP